MVWTDAALEEHFPWIEWRLPLEVTRGTEYGYACRYCIAQLGLGPGTDLMEYDAARKHIEETHR